MNKYLLPFLLKLLILVSVFNIASCDCGNAKTGKNNNENNDDAHEEGSGSIELALTADKTSMTGSDPIQLKIANNGTQSTTLTPTSQIIRTNGLHASIQDDNGNIKYELTLNTINPKNSITQDLIIIPGADIKATFEFQLIYKG